MSSKPSLLVRDYELLESDPEQYTYRSSPPPPTKPIPPQIHPPIGVLRFILHSPWLLAALATGTFGTFACFGFTYWLSSQIFECPTWAFRCPVNSTVRSFGLRLGLVQGILSSLYGIFVAMIAYAAYQIAETTIWPAWSQETFDLVAVDRILAHSRGSLPSFPFAIWRARNPKSIIVILIVALVGVLLQVNATLVGLAFTIVPVPTTFQSNHTNGGGMGFGFSQINPPGAMPGEPSMAYNLYTAWSTGYSTEMLPQLRDYMLDRTNVSTIGNFSVDAIQVLKSISPSAQPVTISNTSYNLLDQGLYGVRTNFDASVSSFGLYSNADSVLLRFQPSILTVWVDSYRNLSATRAVTRLMFAVINGTIEGGYVNRLPTTMAATCLNYGVGPCLGLTSLAYDIDIDLVNGRACTDTCGPGKGNLTALDTMTVQGQGEMLYPLSIWLGAIPSLMGPMVFGAQPMFWGGNLLPNSTLALPMAFSDVTSGGSSDWSQANLTNFINVTSGALATYIANAWPRGWIIMDSVLEMPRLDVARSYTLLIAPAVVLVGMTALALLSTLMHCSANISEVKLGWTSEMLINSITPEIRAVIDDVRSRGHPESALQHMRLRYGRLGDGAAGIGRPGNVRSFAEVWGVR